MRCDEITRLLQGRAVVLGLGENMTQRLSHSPVLVLGRAVPLPPVLEPVGHLGGGEPRGLGQLALLPRRRVRVVLVPVPQHGPRLLLEAVARLLAIPDSPRVKCKENDR